MGLRIATNMAAMSAARHLTRNTQDQAKVYTRLASGQRITQAGDDAAGLSISENLRMQIRSISQAERNANDAISFSQVAEGGLTEIGNSVIRLREMAIQAASDSIGDKERGFIQTEVNQIVSEVDRIANGTNFNGTQLLNGKNEKESLDFQVGIRNDVSDRIQFNTQENDVRAESLGITEVNMENIDNARESLAKIDEAVSKVFGARARLGATQNKMQTAINSIAITKENLTAARSRIADTDVAAETSELVRGNILASAGVAVLSQANATPMQALKLL
jgi:flagellin